MNTQLNESIRRVVSLLVAGEYAKLEGLTHGVRLKANEIATAVSDYGGKLIQPPDEMFGSLNVIEVKNARPKRWSVVMPLWTKEEGRSDLTVEMTAIEQQNGFSIELDDIHVL